MIAIAKPGKIKVPLRYLPANLTRKDRKKQVRALTRSRTDYKRGKYYKRPNVQSFRSRKSNHISRAKKMYNIENIQPNKELSEKTNCSINALKQIVQKGEGAYYSSGSRPNQTPQSWGLARLASAITGEKASAIDFHILKKGCNHKTSKAYNLAGRAYREKRNPTRKVILE